MKTCLLLPAYNEAKTVATIIGEVRQFIPNIVVIDDGSTDQTVAQAIEVSRICKSTVTVLRHCWNQGKGMALRTGFDYALSNRFELIATMDTDGQHQPKELPRLLNHFHCYAPDILIGGRISSDQRSSMPLHRQLNNWLVSAVGSSLCGQRVPDFQSGFRLIRSTVLQAVQLETSRYETESELLIKAGRLGFRIETLSIATIYGSETSDIQTGREMWLFTKLLIKSLQNI